MTAISGASFLLAQEHCLEDVLFLQYDRLLAFYYASFAIAFAFICDPVVRRLACSPSFNKNADETSHPLLLDESDLHHVGIQLAS